MIRLNSQQYILALDTDLINTSADCVLAVACRIVSYRAACLVTAPRLIHQTREPNNVHKYLREFWGKSSHMTSSADIYSPAENQLCDRKGSANAGKISVFNLCIFCHFLILSRCTNTCSNIHEALSWPKLGLCLSSLVKIEAIVLKEENY